MPVTNWPPSPANPEVPGNCGGLSVFASAINISKGYYSLFKKMLLLLRGFFQIFKTHWVQETGVISGTTECESKEYTCDRGKQ